MGWGWGDCAIEWRFMLVAGKGGSSQAPLVIPYTSTILTSPTWKVPLHTRLYGCNFLFVSTVVLLIELYSY